MTVQPTRQFGDPSLRSDPVRVREAWSLERRPCTLPGDR